MRSHQPGPGLLFFLLFPACGTPLPRADLEVRRLEHHVELARKPKAYFQLTPAAVVVYMKGLEVKRLPVERSKGLNPNLPALAYIKSRMSAFPLRQVVVRHEYVPEDPSATVASPEEIVSVDDMPDSFAFELDDGSFVLVTSGASVGFAGGVRKMMLRSRVLLSYLWRRLQRSSLRLILLRMDPPSARHFYWLVQEGMGVIY